MEEATWVGEGVGEWVGAVGDKYIVDICIIRIEMLRFVDSSIYIYENCVTICEMDSNLSTSGCYILF